MTDTELEQLAYRAGHNTSKPRAAWGIVRAILQERCGVEIGSYPMEPEEPN